VEDAKGIVARGDTAATQFFEKRPDEALRRLQADRYSSMDPGGYPSAYKEMIGKYQAVPLASLARTPSLDLDTYVT